MPEVKKLAKIICDPYIFFQIFPFSRCRDLRVFLNVALFDTMPRHLGLNYSCETRASMGFKWTRGPAALTILPETASSRGRGERSREVVPAGDLSSTEKLPRADPEVRRMEKRTCSSTRISGQSGSFTKRPYLLSVCGGSIFSSSRAIAASLTQTCQQQTNKYTVCQVAASRVFISMSSLAASGPISQLS